MKNSYICYFSLVLCSSFLHFIRFKVIFYSYIRTSYTNILIFSANNFTKFGSFCHIPFSLWFMQLYQNQNQRQTIKMYPTAEIEKMVSQGYYFVVTITVLVSGTHSTLALKLSEIARTGTIVRSSII